MGDWATVIGGIGASFETERYEGTLTPAKMASQLRPGVRANTALVAAIDRAGRPPVSDASELSAELRQMVADGTSRAMTSALAIGDRRSLTTPASQPPSSPKWLLRPRRSLSSGGFPGFVSGT